MQYSSMNGAHMMGGGSHIGEVRRGPDGELYEWTQGVDGLGNPIGFWKKIKRAAGKLVRKAVRSAAPLTKFIPGIGPYIDKLRRGAKTFCRYLPKLEPCAKVIPHGSSIYKTADSICNVLRSTGLAGQDGEIMEAPDGSHYEMIHGIGADGAPQTALRRVELVLPAHVR